MKEQQRKVAEQLAALPPMSEAERENMLAEVRDTWARLQQHAASVEQGRPVLQSILDRKANAVRLDPHSLPLPPGIHLSLPPLLGDGRHR